MYWRTLISLPFLLSLYSAKAADFPELPGFIDQMVEQHQFDRDSLTQTFQRAQRLQSVIDAISRPSTRRPWAQYRDGFVNTRNIKNGLAFWSTHAQALQLAEQRYGVPEEIIVALIGVETRYGSYTGRFNTLDALTTLAFDYPRREKFFRSELENFLLLTRELNFDREQLRGSYAGALGIPQFMPSSYRKFAVDFNGDNKIDLLNDPVDAIGSVGNYLKEYGWQAGGIVALRAQAEDIVKVDNLKGNRSLAEWANLGVSSVAPAPELLTPRLITLTSNEDKEFWLAYNNFDVITRYNNSEYYAMSVFLLAENLKNAQRISSKTNTAKP